MEIKVAITVFEDEVELVKEYLNIDNVNPPLEEIEKADYVFHIHLVKNRKGAIH
jgi:hypothetical protein